MDKDKEIARLKEENKGLRKLLSILTQHDERTRAIKTNTKIN